MKRTVASLLFFIISIAVPLIALDVPALKGHVNDYANILTPILIQNLERKLAEFEKKESTQIVVLTIPSLQGEVLEQYSIKVAEKWKIGQKKLDNGVILLVAKQDRKIRIEVGYGLEGRLTDALAGRIIDNDIKPSLKKGDYDTGITKGVRSIIQAVQGEYSAKHLVPDKIKSILLKPWFWPVTIIGLILLILYIIATVITRSTRSVRSDGSSRGSSFDSDNYRSSSSSSSDSGSSSSSSSSDSGGSSGGGDYGGGGASGDY